MQSGGAAGGSPIHTARRHFRSFSAGVHGDIHTQLAQDLDREHVRLLLAKSIGQVRDVLDGDDGVQLAQDQDGCGEDELGLVLVMCPVHFVLARCPIAIHHRCIKSTLSAPVPESSFRVPGRPKVHPGRAPPQTLRRWKP